MEPRSRSDGCPPTLRGRVEWSRSTCRPWWAGPSRCGCPRIQRRRRHPVTIWRSDRSTARAARRPGGHRSPRGRVVRLRTRRFGCDDRTTSASRSRRSLRRRLRVRPPAASRATRVDPDRTGMRGRDAASMSASSIRTAARRRGTRRVGERWGAAGPIPTSTATAGSADRSGEFLARCGSDDRRADLDEDGVVGGGDLGMMLAAWG